MKAILAICLVLLLTGVCFGAEVSDDLLNALKKKENPKGNVHAVGDRNLAHHAYGNWQIRQPYLTDVNRIVGKKAMRVVWGKSVLTLQDIKDSQKARWVVEKYLNHYGKVYQNQTGLEPTDEVYARIHNGGPLGWKKVAATDDYWADVSWELRTIRYRMAMASVNRDLKTLENWHLEREVD